MKEELKETKEKVDATNSFLFTIRDKDNCIYNFILPLINFATEESKEKVSLIFHKNLSQIESKLGKIDRDFLLVADYTDDPTPQYAGSVVSLGYPLIRIEFKKTRITRFNPLVLEGNAKDLNIKFNREQRSSLINMPKYKEVKEKIEMKGYSSIRYYYLIPRGFEQPLYVISCITGEHNFNFIQMIDMTSFYSGPILIYHRRNRDSKKAINHYKDLIIEWARKQKRWQKRIHLF